MRKITYLSVLLFSLSVGDAMAHAVLLGSNPTGDQVLDTAPSEIVLNFNENVGPIFFKVLNAQGTEVGSPGEIRVAGNDVFLPLGDTLENGTYVITYRVISADTHPVGGSFLFAVGEPIADMGAVGDAGGAVSGWRIPVALNRWLLYAAGTLAAGTALLLSLLRLPGPIASVAKSQGRLAAVLANVALVLAPGLGGAEMVAGGAGALFNGGSWSTGIASTLGPSALIGIPGAVLLWFLFGKERPAVLLLLVGAALLLGSFLVTGHAATAPPAWVMALVVAVHLVAVGFWFSALWPLRVAVTDLPPTEATELLEAFSAKGVWAVALLGLSGIGISFVQMQSFGAFFDTDYGVRLLIKLGLVLFIVGLALFNKRRLTGKLAAAADVGREALRRTIGLEVLLMLVILAMAVSLTLPSPPRALAAGASGASGAVGFTTQAIRNDYVANVEVTPARPGENMIMVSFTDSEGNPVGMQSAAIVLGLPAASLEGIEKDGEAMSQETYHFTVSEMIIPGEWELRIDAFVDDFDKQIFRTTITIQ